MQENVLNKFRTIIFEVPTFATHFHRKVVNYSNLLKKYYAE